MPVLPRWASIHGVAGLFLGVLTGCGDDGTGLPTGLEACGSPPFLTVSPLAFGDIHEIAPLGNLNPPGHVFPTDHIYFYTSGFIGSGTRSVPLVSPSDVVTTEVTVNRRTANLAPSFAARVGTLGGSCDPPVGTIHCYETGIPPGQRRILLMLVSQTRIRVQGSGSGACGDPSTWAFGQGAAEFQR
jgi:hypothetical protein